MKSKIGVNFLVSVGRTPDTGDNALAKLLQASQEMVSLFCPIHLVLSDFLQKLTWALRIILHLKSFVKICLFAMALVSNCLEYAILSVRPRPSVRLSVTKMTDPSFSNALLYWMFSDQ